MAVLSELEPKRVFDYFEKLCSVPHGSHNTKRISDLCVAFAQELGLKYRQDEANNVVIWKDAAPGYEKAVPVILQGHIDMVCVKTEDCTKAMAEEGLLSKAFIDGSEESSGTYLENDLGFMHYDYNQTQTLMNATKLNKDGDEGEKYMAVMVPVARWDDGTGEQFMRFTESWRSVKTDGWGISKSGVGDSTDKLNACLALIDFAYSEEGQILMSYGPEAWRSSETFLFNGNEMPKISEACEKELWDLAGGNYTNYARWYLGSTLSFLKSQAFEYQCTHEVGKEGAGYISTAIGLGTIKHPELALASNPWYTIVPTVLPTTKVENDTINGYTELTDRFNQQKDGGNMLLELIVNGYTNAAMQDAVGTADNVAGSWSGKQYLAIKQSAWEKDIAYYETLK